MQSEKELTLIKPIFIEESFTAPFMSKDLQSKIESATEWLKTQNISDNLFGLPSGTNVKTVLVGFLEESINLNRKLEEKYQAFTVQDYQAYSNPLHLEINVSDVVNDCFVFNLDNANYFFNKCCFMISPYFPHYEKVFGRTLNEEELKFCKHIHFYLDKWYKAAWYFVYDELVLKKPVFIEESFIMPLFNKEFSKELLNILKWFNTYVSDKQLSVQLSDIINEIIKINDRLLINIDFDKYLKEQQEFNSQYYDNNSELFFTRLEFYHINPSAKINYIDKDSVKSPFITNNNDLHIGIIRRRIEDHLKKTENLETGLKLEFIDRFLLELTWGNFQLKNEFHW